MPSIRKDLKDINKNDVEALCRDKVAEDEQIDFKETVPSRADKGGDPWRDKRAIADYGRDQLLAAVVGFANSYGGDLVIGVREDGGKPGSAEQVTPVEDCADLALRLMQQAHSLIEPQIPNLNAVGVLTEANGAGVVVVRVGRSRLAPHRLSSTLQCYQRVRHETLPMSMRQIQDLTFSVSRGLDAIERRFVQARTDFRSWAALDQLLGEKQRVAFRVTAIPASTDCYLPKVHNVDEVRPRQRVVRVKLFKSTAPEEWHTTISAHHWRPVLRGSVSEDRDDHHDSRVSVYCDGVVSYEFGRTCDPNSQYSYSRNHLLYYGWLFGCIVNAIECADSFRQQAGAAGAEYALEIEVATSHPVAVIRQGASSFTQTIGHFPAGFHCFPRYAIGGKDTWNEVLTLIRADFWNALGSTVPDDQIELDPP